MRTQLQYGRGDLKVEIPSSDVTVLRTKHEEGMPDEAAAFREAVRNPIGSAPLRELVGAKDRVAVVIPDITLPLPSDRLLPWLFEELSHVPAENVVIVNGTGSHRPNTLLEFDQNPNALRTELLGQPITPDEHGIATVPEGSGLGVRLDRETLRRYAAAEPRTSEYGEI